MKKKSESFDFGWSLIWMNGYWIAGLAFLGLSIWLLLINLSLLQFIGVFLLLFSLNLFGGNFVWRRSRSLDYMTLPLTSLLQSDHDHVLDACCGSGRTTLELSKVIKEGRITALDKFDAEYIKGGGRQLLEENLKKAKIEDEVTIVQGDVTDLKFDEGTFDAIISSHALDHIRKEQLSALKELHGVLKSGGRFLLIVLVPNIYTFLVANLLCLYFTSRKKWRRQFSEVGFDLKEEGMINGSCYFLLEK